MKNVAGYGAFGARLPWRITGYFSVDKIVIEENKVEQNAEQEYMGIIIPDGKENILDDVLDVVSSYSGDIPVIVAMGGKKYNAHVSTRRCEGLLIELKNYLPADNVIFFKKKC